MIDHVLPEIHVSTSLSQEINEVALKFDSVDAAEISALANDISTPLHTSDEWVSLCNTVTDAIANQGYVVLRGLGTDGGKSLLIVSTILGPAFHTYAPGHVVKRFRMSPWTKELSHTTREGDFHTDANVADCPPIGTAIQCELEDPGAPQYAEQRVAHLPHLLKRLASVREYAAGLSLITHPDVGLAHERSAKRRRGPLVENEIIRYHPHSIRIANERLGAQAQDVEPAIAAIHQAALDVSVPFHTQLGDTLLVSNRTALHYRGECSVRFTKFPMQFDSRSVLVLHVRDRAD